MGRRYQIVSADSHVNPPPTFWREYLPSKLKERAPYLESTPEGTFEVFEGKRSKFLLFAALAGKKFEDFKAFGEFEEGRPGGWDPHQRVSDQGIDGVDAEVLFGGGPLVTEDEELLQASFRAYNDWLADYCKPYPERLIGIAYIPIWNVKKATAETRRTAKKWLKGITIPARPDAQTTAAIYNLGRPLALPYDDPAYEPFWSTLEELEIPAHIHLGAHLTKFDTNRFLIDACMSKVSMAGPIAQFIFTGILERHPKLRLVSVESGAGWCAFLVKYMDHEWHRHRFWTKSSLKEPPSFYFHRQVSATIIDDPVAVKNRDVIGVENIMWSSDYPHGQTTFPHSRRVIESNFSGVPEEEKYKMVCGNAVRLYHLAG